MNVLLGFDPGGDSSFGWCVVEDGPALPLRIIASGLARDAASATQAALGAVSGSDEVRAAGIDAPLVWARSGGRVVDAIVRKAIGKAGATHPSGTVQSVNSLRGACLAQGLLAALALREVHTELPISEAHPKALRWLDHAAAVQVAASEHERDATLAAFSAWAMWHRPTGWIDLFEQEGAYFTPLASPLAYMMPASAGQDLG